MLFELAKRAATIPNLWLAFNFDDFVATENTELVRSCGNFAWRPSEILYRLGQLL
jgi:methionyl-tRNA synthetase